MRRVLIAVVIVAVGIFGYVALSGIARAADRPRVVEVVGLIDGDTIEAVEKALDGVKPGDAVDVRIDSGGGGVFAGLRVIELLRQSGATTTCRVGGAALSMAAVILESPACGARVVRPWSILMFHRVSTGVDRADGAQLTKILRTSLVLDRALALIVAPRAGITPGEYLDRTEHEMWMTGTDAVRDGFADEEQP